MALKVRRLYIQKDTISNGKSVEFFRYSVT